MTVDTDMNISPVLGNNQDNRLTGTGRSEVLSGAGGDDTIFALSGNDEVFGGTGNDLLYGHAGNDTIYGNGKPAYVDMTNMLIKEQTTAKVTFMDEGAGFRNSLGVYEIADDGSISNVQILFANASKQGSGGDLLPGQSATTFDVSADVQLGFFVVSNGYGKGYENRIALDGLNGTYEMRTQSGASATIHGPMELYYIDHSTGEEIHVKSQYANGLFHSAATEDDNFAVNPDNYLHVVGRASTVTGSVLIGFEDLYGGGDNDYDDTIINIELGQTNVVGLLPPPSPSSGNKPDDDIIYGGDGDDILYGISGHDYLYGGNGNDELSGNSGNDKLFGNGGIDILNGNSGNDILQGGSGNDTLNGNSGDDELSGDNGNDFLSGGSGHDRAFGGSGDDVINGGSGMDMLFGGSGNDTINGNSGDDIIFGDTGSDTLNGQSGDDTLSGGNGTDKLIGGGGDDILFGGLHNDKLYGGSGNDRLEGDEGHDYLTAGSGNDIIEGGLDNDKLRGGSGADIFVFDFSDGDLGDDRIYDFEQVDTISLLNSGLSDFVGLQDYITDTSRGAVIDFENDISITIHSMDLANLSEELFMFG